MKPLFPLLLVVLFSSTTIGVNVGAVIADKESGIGTVGGVAFLSVVGFLLGFIVAMSCLSK